MANDLQLAASATSRLSESDIRINFNNLQQFIGGANQSGGMLVFASNNGGANWATTTLPLVAGHSFLSDPTFDWTSDGTAWALAIAFSNDASNNPTNLQVASFKSTNATSSSPTWTFDSIVSGTQTNTDKASLWVDRSPTSLKKDNLYAIWHNGVASFVSIRAGKAGAWQTPVQVSGSETKFTSDGGDVKTNQFGDVFAFWPAAGGRTIQMAKFPVSGTRFGSPQKVADTFGKFEIGVPAENTTDNHSPLIYVTAGAFRTASQDLVFAAWLDLAGGAGCNTPANAPGTNTISACKTRIRFTRSTDGGATWSTPFNINDQASLNDQFHPRLAVDEITGELVIIYYDTVNDAGRIKTDVWMQRSSDLGVSWTGATKITSSTTDETSAGADSANRYGDYIGITGHSGSFFGTWTDRRNAGNEEIWGAAVTIRAQRGSTVTALQPFKGHVDLFVPCDDGTVMSTFFEVNGGWREWFKIHPEIKVPSGATVTALQPFKGHVDLFTTRDHGARDDGTVMSTFFEANSGWREWFEIRSDTKVPSDATVTALQPFKGHVDLFVTSFDGRVLSTFFEANGGWREWFEIPSKIKMHSGATVTALKPFDGHVDLFVMSDDGRVLSTFFEANGGWRGWFEIPSEIKMHPGATVTALKPFDGHVDLFVTSDDGRVLSTFFEANGGWREWFEIPSEIKMHPGATVTALKPFDGHVDLFVTSDDGRVLSTFFEANGGWRGWFEIPSQIKMHPGATVTALKPFDGHVDLFVTSDDGRVLSTFFEANGGWRGWFTIL